MLKDLSASAIIAGFMAVLVSYSGPLAILIHAADKADVSVEMLTSWIWAISIGAAVSGIYLSYKLKIPIVTAWSAPGTVLLVSLFPELSLNEVVSAYITAAVIIIFIGITGLFEHVMRFIPTGVSAAMMAGILFEFGLRAFHVLETDTLFLLLMLTAFIFLKQLFRAYFLVLFMLVGLVISLLMLDVSFQGFKLSMARPQIIEPHWTISSTLSLALPLVIVSLSGQFLPGFGILKIAGYPSNSAKIINATGLISIPMAFFGGITNVIAAITASICTSDDSHPDKNKRYIAGMANGFFYLIGGTFAGSIVLFFQMFPTQLISIIAGFSLITAIGASVSVFTAEKDYLDASLVTFIITSSGTTIFGIGSAFWGVVLGCAAYYLSRALRNYKNI